MSSGFLSLGTQYKLASHEQYRKHCKNGMVNEDDNMWHKASKNGIIKETAREKVAMPKKIYTFYGC